MAAVDESAEPVARIRCSAAVQGTRRTNQAYRRNLRERFISSASGTAARIDQPLLEAEGFGYSGEGR